MRVFLSAVVMTVVIGVCAAAVLSKVQESSTAAYTVPGVRL
jgi:hypothetical protein